MYIYIYIYIQIHTYTYIYIYIYIYTWIISKYRAWLKIIKIIYIYRYMNIYIYIYGATHSLIALSIEQLCFREKGLWRCLNLKNVMILLSILNVHRRITIFCSGEHFSIYALVWCSWSCLGRMQVLHICFDIVVVLFFFVFFIFYNANLHVVVN